MPSPRPAAILVQFAKAVRQRRESLKMSQQTAAESAGLSITYWSKVERVKVNVSLANIEKIAHALKCQPVDLLAGTGYFVRAAMKKAKD